MDKLIEVLQGIRPDIDFRRETDLVGSGLIDSADIMMIVTEIEAAFGVSVTMEYFQPKYFASAESIMKMIEELQ